MPSIAREQENQTDVLNWFIAISGSMVDVFLIEYRILDISAGLPGTQVFPAASGTYEDVTTGTGHFSTGSYYAYDNDNEEGWRPGAAEPIGTHRIEWRWKATSSSSYQSDTEDFEVLAASVGTPADLYISVQDVRDAGMSSTVASNSDVLAAIELWQQVVDRLCRQWFSPRVLTIRFDGTDSDTIHLGVPIIDVVHLKINGAEDALDPSHYLVYKARSYPDDRRNPRIKLNSLSNHSDIYTAPIMAGHLKFLKGRQNCEVKGVFGFVEEDGSCPAAIKRALTKLVIEKLSRPLYVGAGETPPAPPPIFAGLIEEEWTDGHKIKYATEQLVTKPQRTNPIMGITSDPEISTLLRLYRAPLGIATPAHASHVDR